MIMHLSDKNVWGWTPGQLPKSLEDSLTTHIGHNIIPIHKITFNDQEIKFKILENLEPKTLKIVFSLFPNIHDSLFELLLLTDACWRAGVEDIQILIPYLPYARQDRTGFGESAGFSVILETLKQTRASKIFVIDCHSSELIKPPFYSLTTLPLWKSLILQNHPNAVLVTPDQGGYQRLLTQDDDLPITRLRKTRCSQGPIVIEAVDEEQNFHNKDCIVIDDIIDSGQTLISTSHFLKKHGAKSCHAYVTHGLFSKGLNGVMDHYDSLTVSNSIELTVMHQRLKSVDIWDFLLNKAGRNTTVLSPQPFL